MVVAERSDLLWVFMMLSRNGDVIDGRNHSCFHMSQCFKSAQEGHQGILGTVQLPTDLVCCP